MIKKIIFSCFFLFVSLLKSQSQDKLDLLYEKLDFLYIDEKYESLLRYSLNLQKNQNLKNDPRPFAYAAMAYFELSKSGDKKITKKYPNALAEAITQTISFYKKDKKELFKAQFSDFTLALKQHLLLINEAFWQQASYNKSAGVLAKIIRFQPQDTALILALGVAQIYSKNFNEGFNLLQSVQENIHVDLKIARESAPIFITALSEYQSILTNPIYEKHRKATKFESKENQDLAGIIDYFKSKYPQAKNEIQLQEQKRVYKKFENQINF